MCPVLKRKGMRQQASVKYINATDVMSSVSVPQPNVKPVFESFVSSGHVSLGVNEVKNLVKVLRHTGAAQSFVLERVLPF